MAETELIPKERFTGIGESYAGNRNPECILYWCHLLTETP